jgi:hypothetical protein
MSKHSGNRNFFRNRRRQPCGMCRRRAGRLYVWGSKKLCKTCYSEHCRGYIRTDNLLKKLGRTAPSQSRRQPQRLSLWQRLFG